MSTVQIWQTMSIGSADTLKLGELLGSKLTGGEVIELRSDLGGGKTTFTKGLAKGAGIRQEVISPTFTIQRIYKAPKFEIHHFDFYRLNEPGIVRNELAESLGDEKVVTVIEWSDIVKDVLPDERISVELKPTSNNPDERDITITYPEKLAAIIQSVETAWRTGQP